MQRSCTYVMVVSVVMSGVELRVVKCVRRGVVFGQGQCHKSDQCKHRNLRNIRLKSSTVERRGPLSYVKDLIFNLTGQTFSLLVRFLFAMPLGTISVCNCPVKLICAISFFFYTGLAFYFVKRKFRIQMMIINFHRHFTEDIFVTNRSELFTLARFTKNLRGVGDSKVAYTVFAGTIVTDPIGG